MRGARRPGIAAVEITASATRDARVEHCLLLGLFLFGEFARVAAAALGRDAGLDELGAEGLDLLAGGAAHVVCFDHRAQPLGGGDCLQAGDADADDQHRRRPDGAGRSGQHRQEPIERIGGNQRGLVAADRGLRRQRIHRLGARDARYQFHRERRNLPVTQRAHHIRLRVRLHEADHHRAGPEPLDLADRRWLHGQQDIGRREYRLGAVGPFDLLVQRIRELGADTGTAFQQYPRSQCGELVGDLGDQTDARFPARALPKPADRDWHSDLPTVATGLRGRCTRWRARTVQSLIVEFSHNPAVSYRS